MRIRSTIWIAGHGRLPHSRGTALAGHEIVLDDVVTALDPPHRLGIHGG
jgi:hypothetical protein